MGSQQSSETPVSENNATNDRCPARVQGTTKPLSHSSTGAGATTTAAAEKSQNSAPTNPPTLVSKHIATPQSLRFPRISLVEQELSELEEDCVTFAGARNFESSQKIEGHQCKALPFSFGTYSRPGNDPERIRKENQDSLVVIDQWGGQRGQCLACVFDGHGPNGRLVSNFCRDVWQATLLAELTLLHHKQLKEVVQIDPSANLLKQIISASCEKTSLYLQNSPIDIYVSGTTMTGFVCVERKCWSINIGDSRMVGCTKNGAMYKAVDLTVDQTPNRPDEKERITHCHGRVFEWGGVPRVWLPEVDMPGLAISRSFGDFALDNVGVNSLPEVRAFEMNQETPFVIIASGGVWEFISSQVAVDLVAVFHANGKSSQEACTALVNESLRLWNEEEDIVDDITVIVVFNLDFGDELPNLKPFQHGIDLGQESLGKNTTVAPSSSSSTAVVHGTTNDTLSSSEPTGTSTIEVPMNKTVVHVQEEASPRTMLEVTDSIDDQLETKSVDSEVSGFSDFSQ